ncbi:MAG TPA: 50S ribosomal protein L18 [Candidatus Krumholzibacteria bacterium]|nr:50S ribosomal protein L18 [Candidatus Krumholzibacteria bacterium]HPD72069.1 50S ribosomal protein L18 [Candidatus Krumholzibacteria bacterium]HRY40998.1 50S ribosomal protein L18 [Candidatus Krumholzibacteria bacterium]
MSEFSKTRRTAWLKRKQRVGRRLHGTADKPRLTVFRSHRSIYAQLVDDDRGHTLAWSDAARAGDCKLPEGLAGKRALAYRVGHALAEQAKAKGVARVVFDRNGYLYHGRVAALAQGARDGGLEF